MSEPDIITAEDIRSEHGEEMLDRMLDFAWHRIDDRGQPYWLAGVAADILGLIEIEDREIEEREEA
jgi:hypothetical protein